jgi:hypothetical protein
VGRDQAAGDQCRRGRAIGRSYAGTFWGVKRQSWRAGSEIRALLFQLLRARSL